MVIIESRTQNFRNFSFICFILFLTCPIVTTSALADTNLVVNPGFEIGAKVPMNWTLISQNGIIPIWDNVSHSGSKSVKISISGRRNKISGYPRSDLISVSPLTEYTVSVWGKTQNAGGTNTPAARVVELDANKNWIRQTNLPVFSRGTNNWTQKTIEFKTRSNTKYIYIYANIWKGYGTFWLDDVTVSLITSTITITPTPTPISVNPLNIVEENFNGTTLNATLWLKPLWENGVPANVIVANGMLKTVVTTPKTSASIVSMNKYGYGEYTIRMKFPGNDDNLRGAFWLRNGDLGEEIDIEYYHYMPNSIDLTIYNNNDVEIVTRRVVFTYDLSKEFHIWKINWSLGTVVWSMDGIEIFRYTGSNVPMYPMWIRAKADNPSWRPDNINSDYTLVDYINYAIV